MEFNITGKFNDRYHDECLALWRFSSKEAFSSLKTYSIIFLAYLVIGLLYYLRGKPISLFISSLGIVCFILLIIQLLNIYHSKTKTKRDVLDRIYKYKNNLTALRELVFMEDCIRYCNPEMLLELKWTAISHYQHYGDYVLFFMNESKKPAFSMDKKNIPEQVEADLFAFINSKILRTKSVLQ